MALSCVAAAQGAQGDLRSVHLTSGHQDDVASGSCEAEGMSCQCCFFNERKRQIKNLCV